MQSVKLFRSTRGNRLQVRVSYNEAFIKAAKSICGHWRPATGIWSFDMRQYDSVTEILNRVFKTNFGSADLANLPIAHSTRRLVSHSKTRKVVMRSMHVGIERDQSELLVSAPYDRKFLAHAHRLGGEWNPTLKCRSFRVEDYTKVVQALNEVYGTELPLEMPRSFPISLPVSPFYQPEKMEKSAT